MPRLQLTDLTIRALKSDAQTDHWDTKTPGFGVRVGKLTKTFIAKVQNQRHTIGQYPDVSLQDARRKALALKSEKRADRTEAPRLRDAVEEFLTGLLCQAESPACCEGAHASVAQALPANARE